MHIKRNLVLLSDTKARSTARFLTPLKHSTGLITVNCYGSCLTEMSLHV